MHSFPTATPLALKSYTWLKPVLSNHRRGKKHHFSPDDYKNTSDTALELKAAKKTNKQVLFASRRESLAIASLTDIPQNISSSTARRLLLRDSQTGC